MTALDDERAPRQRPPEPLRQPHGSDGRRARQAARRLDLLGWALVVALLWLVAAALWKVAFR